MCLPCSPVDNAPSMIPPPENINPSNILGKANEPFNNKKHYIIKNCLKVQIANLNNTHQYQIASSQSSAMSSLL
jgi:hypothetical protein